MIDHVLVLRYPTGRADLDDQIERMLFLSRSGGSTIDDDGSEMSVTVYFDTEEDRREAGQLIEGVDEIRAEEQDRPHADWLELYRQSLEAIPVGQRFVVAPHESLIEPAGRLPIIIPQEHAFGTGGHASTSLCLELMETLDLGGAIGLDVGTGSGILALGMHRLGARRVYAFDDDIDTFGVVARNLERNGVAAGRVLQFFGTIDAVRRVEFDIVAINIIAEVIVPMLPEVRVRVRRGGSVVVSGVIDERVGGVVEAAAESSLALEDALRDGEWWGGRFRAC